MNVSTRDAANRIGARAQGAADTAADRASSFATDARDALGSAGDSLRDGAREAGDRASDFADHAYRTGKRVASQAADTAEAYPVATLVVGIAIGWMVNSLLRATR